GQLAREADVLPAAADRLRKLLLGDRDIHAVRVLVDDDRQNVRRRHRVDDELRRILVIENDVDPLAGELVRDRLDARAAHADARADRVDPRVVAAHGDLRPKAGIARGREDLDQALTDLGHLDLEKLDQKLGRRARQKQLRAARLRAHLAQQALDAVLRLDRLARDQILARDEPFGVAAEIDVGAVAVHPLHDAGQELADAVLVGLDDLLALGLAHLLHNDLLRGLRGDAPELDRLHRLLDVAARLGVRIDLERVLEPELPRGLLELGRIVREDLPAPKSLVLAGGPIDRHAHVDILAVPLASRGRERRFDGLEDHALVDALLVRNGVGHHQDLFVHHAALSYADYSGTNLASAMSASSTRHAVPSTSIRIAPPSTESSRPFRRLRPSRACASSTRTSRPTKRSK